MIIPAFIPKFVTHETTRFSDFFLVIVWGNAQTQSPPLPEDYFVIEGDTIINSSIELKEVVLFQPLAIL
jgi:hypothetical protein